ncbi:DUF2516 family protein [Cellulomonas persica]|uniref:DUF2516 domain-containing protein n=1 Tax=Cellulomonas persica TaxID=76861 RepID=A0A510URH0_9CELL|nr:DUF2516 family protein [Cellulomonas persica]GEK17233.1 hypothetical protein CPE01_09660 [Cellulomonas persica]
MGIVGSLQWILYLLFLLVIFALCVWALVDLLLRPASAFPSAGKRTKNFWLLILAVATFLAFLALPPLQLLPFLGLLSAVAAIVYLVDVKPAVAPYSRKRRGPGRGPGGSTGGW